MPVDEELVAAAVALARDRFADEPWGGAAALMVSTGEILTSVGTVGTLNAGATLCHETGAILEAHKRRLTVTDSVCVARSDRGTDRFLILTPCGICQERLMAWGPVAKSVFLRWRVDSVPVTLDGRVSTAKPSGVRCVPL